MKNFIITLVFAFVTNVFYAQGAFDKFDGLDDVTSVIVNVLLFTGVVPKSISTSVSVDIPPNVEESKVPLDPSVSKVINFAILTY